MDFRPPIVTVMGHIDHGKTSLLDKIRSTNVTAREAGGITQRISAYQVEIKRPTGNRLITFMDTPGHAAFINIRSRGAQVTDIVVLVIAATEGVMPQTRESIELIKKLDLPVIVAMTKFDLETRQPEKVKGQLVELGLTPEEYGGQVPIIPVSSKTGEGIDQLLDVILLNADVMELKSEPNASLEALVIESQIDKNRGPVATIMVKKGTIKVGDIVYANQTMAKVKALFDSTAKPITSAGPSVPAEILGFESVPAVGCLITAEAQAPSAPVAKPISQSVDTDRPRLPIVVKADVNGSLEALLNSFSDDVQILSSGVGAVTDNDVAMAQSTHAQIFAFNVKTPSFVQKLAENEGVKIIESKIIYEILDMIEAQVLKLLEPTIDENILGEGTIKAEFKINGTRIAGLDVTKGVISKGDSIHLKRDGKIIKDTKVEGIHQAKNIVDKVKSGNDCGLTFKPYVDFKVGDGIISYNKLD